MRIAIDLSSLLGGQQAIGRVSFLEEVRLTVTSGDDAFTLSETLAPSDSIATFDVSVSPGSVDFDVEVYSNGGVLTHTASTPAIIDEEGFVVTIVVAAMAPVMVISPGTAIAQVAGVSGQQFTNALLVVRNAGSRPLTWGYDSTASTGNFSCVMSDLPCRGLTVAPGARHTASFFGNAVTPGVYAITFASAEGTVIARIRVP